MSFSSSSSFNNPPPWSRSSSTASSYQNVGGPTYPIKRPHSPNNYSNSYQHTSSMSKKTSSGYVTKLYDSWGIIDNEIQFSFNACIKGIPKLKDYVTVETIHSPGTTYKWRATKVILTNNGRDYSNLKPIPNFRSENDYRRPRILDKSRERSRERRFDEIDRKRFKRDDKEDKLREFDNNSFKDREKPREFERSPVRRSRSPFKRKVIRYAVKVPGDVLTLSEADIITLKKRYPALYIPSDFFSSTIRWCDTFPVSRPFTLNRPCSFHIMPKDCDSYVQNDAIASPPDLDYTFSAKIMLISVPRMEEVYKKAVCLAEDLPRDDDKNYMHFSRLIQFLVGSRGKNEPLAIGGPWSPSLDGESPDKDPSVLIRTAIRTCKALTGIDLSACSQWYRFMEVYYHRSESVHKGKTYPARVETVVFFLPEAWNCVPSCLEWDNIILGYKNLVEKKLHPDNVDESTNHSGSGDQNEESDKEEDLVVIDKCEEKIGPTHYSELDPENMKVNDLRHELEVRSLSVNGLKHQLIHRLELALRKERDLEEEEHGKMKINEDATILGALKVVDIVKDDDVSENGESKERKIDSPTSDDAPEIIDRVILERNYALPELPHIVVHPSKTAKAGKFDCFIMSLAALLDYRANENKEHSFELFLFAELFHEMLQRDFGFQIYKSLCEAPEKAKEDEKKAEKDVSKLNSPDKSGKLEENDESPAKEDKNEKKLNDSKMIDERSDNDSKSGEEVKKKDRGKLITKDPFLLLSYCFFDRSYCGYIFDKDLETLLFSLGLHLSRHQVKKLISKVAVRDTIHYRKFTDKAESEEDCPKSAISIESIALGNKKYFPVFTDLITSLSNKNKVPSQELNKRGVVCIDGIVVDVEKVTSNLKKSESIRLELENQLLKYKKEMDVLKESLKKSSEREKKLNEEYKTCREKLAATNKDKLSYSNKSRTYYKVLMNIKEQIGSIEEKSEKNITKTAKLNEKTDEKETTKSKKELSEERVSNDKSVTSDKEKKNSSNEETKNSNEKSDENEMTSSSKNTSNLKKAVAFDITKQTIT